MRSAQDADAGETVFKKCMTCHRIGEGAKNAVGPEQNGSSAGRPDRARASPIRRSTRRRARAGLIWNEETIFAYLPDPNAFLKKFLTDERQARPCQGLDEDGVQAARASRSARTSSPI